MFKMATRSLLLFLFVDLFSFYWGNEAADIRSCMDRFVVHSNKIIRTQDSRALGAKYLNEAEVASREDCLQLCCETTTCDVFVYEHKRRGSCYLFHCGDPQDFKCKFTEHRNYSSGLLMPPNELEAQIKLTKHEEELAQLSKKTEGVVVVGAAAAPSTSTPLPVTAKVPTPTKLNSTARSECSRYQFECRSTRECIAIYNACDGIPQCPDGSDEGPELDCPTLAGTARPAAPSDNKASIPAVGNIQTSSEIKKSYPQQFAYPPFVGNEKMDQNQVGLDAHQQLLNARMYGREGEGPADGQAANGWRSYLGQSRGPAEEGSRIFNHKGGLMPDGDSGGPSAAYSNEMSRSDYQKASGGNYYGMFPYNNGQPYNWPQRPRGDEQKWMYPGSPQDYYYEESQGRPRLMAPQTEHKLQPEVQPVKPVEELASNNKHVDKNEKTTLIKVEDEKQKEKETVSVKKVIAETKAPTPTQANKLMGLVMEEEGDVVIVPVDGENEHPRGAILSLALGMCIAAIMITVVGCRLRIVQRRLRRGKGGYSHDADFLVNGMYL